MQKAALKNSHYSTLLSSVRDKSVWWQTPRADTHADKQSFNDCMWDFLSVFF